MSPHCPILSSLHHQDTETQSFSEESNLNQTSQSPVKWLSQTARTQTGHCSPYHMLLPSALIPSMLRGNSHLNPRLIFSLDLQTSQPPYSKGLSSQPLWFGRYTPVVLPVPAGELPAFPPKVCCCTSIDASNFCTDPQVVSVFWNAIG